MDASHPALPRKRTTLPSECRNASSCTGASIEGKEDLAYAPSAGVEALQDEPPVVDVDDGQFLIERLLQKRVRRVKRRKVVQYLVKWKGYLEEENMLTL